MHDPMNVLEPADPVPMSVPIQMPRSDSPHFRSGRAWVRAPMPPIEEEYPASWASQEVDPMEHEYIPMDQLQEHFGDVNSPSTVDQELVSILFYPFFRSLFEISNIWTFPYNISRHVHPNTPVFNILPPNDRIFTPRESERAIKDYVYCGKLCRKNMICGAFKILVPKNSRLKT